VTLLEVELAVPAVPESWPRLRPCGRCGLRVLLARLLGEGQTIVLEAVEVFPEGTCGRCSGRGTVQARVDCGTGAKQTGGMPASEPGDLFGRTRLVSGSMCPACWGRGVRGEPVPRDVVALDRFGVVRHLGPGEDRRVGEAFHRLHRCG
jgi:hypothetical protein